MQDNTTVFTNATVYVHKDGRHVPKQVNVYVDNQGLIEFMQSTSDDVIPEYAEIVDLSGKVVVPGGVNTHEHGFGGVYDKKGTLMNCTEGVWQPQTPRRGSWLDDEAHLRLAFEHSCYGHAKHGATTLFLAALATTEQKLRLFSRLGSEYCEQDGITQNLMGLYVEGNFLFPGKGYTGAQDPNNFIQPSIANYRRLLGDNPFVKIVGIGAEYANDRKTINLIRELSADNIYIGVGHSGAKRDNVFRILNESGAMVFIHLGNGPNGSNYKTGLGQVMQAIMPSVALAREHGYRLFIEQISDGRHINPAIRAWIKKECPELFLGVGDNIGAMLDMYVKYFKIGKISGEVADDGSLWVKGKDSTMFGSSTSFDRSLESQVRTWMTPNIPGLEGVMSEFSSVPVFPHPLSFADAMSEAITELCTNPARAYDLDDVGAIETGKRADFAVFEVKNEDDPKKLEMEIKDVYIGGKHVS
jgi:N-acetylglucosamine-6-phosphate deacetylase